ncbi:MAG: hypothetical protein JRN11_07400 [Nitrososphaerota archaeon]|nr:hypothetical protein [Nitrososphaerota archaeon]MDG7013212.1 hypothetical protein [Nitrososphaerota archaeon]MDG7026556.1 hypothetical protein [Nitrososphaerota archaeon]
MKRSPLVLAAAILLLLLPSASIWTPAVSAQPPTAPAVPLPPVSIRLTAIPPQLPPGGSGVVIVQLVDADGDPSPARADVTVSLFSSDPTVASVSQQVAIAFGKSHAEARVQAGTEGSATLTATADGFLSGFAKVSASVFSDFALSLIPMNNPVAPGDSVHLRVGLMAAGKPFETPVGVQVSVSTSFQGIPQQTVEVQPGSSDAYLSVPVPSGSSLQAAPFMTITAAAAGFTSATTGVGLSLQGSNPQEALVGPLRANLTAGSSEFLAVSLFNGTFAPASGSLTLDLFSSNSSVVKLRGSQVTLSGSDSAVFPVYANATGTAQVTAIAPGLTSIPLAVAVVAPFKPSLRMSLPSRVRSGETYSFSVGFYYGVEPIPYGPVAVHLSSSDANVTFPSEVEASALGYALGTFAAQGTGVANVTAVLEGAAPATSAVVSVYSPAVAPVTYTITAASDSGPLAGVPVNFTYGGRTSLAVTGPTGAVDFAAYNDTAALASVPHSVTLANRTYYFTGWSDGAKTENVSLLASSPTLSMTAQYFRSVVPTAYSLQALSDGQEPVAGLRFNVYSPTLGENFTLSTSSEGVGSFVLPNASSFEISVPELYQPPGQTRYSLLSLENSTRNAVNITASVAITVEAKYATYYQFQVASPIGNTTGSGWYRSGASAAYSVDEASSGGPLVYQRFSGWTGSFSSDQPSGSTVITSPEFITAQWSTDNSLLFAAVGVVIAATALIGLFIFRFRKKAPLS